MTVKDLKKFLEKFEDTREIKVRIDYETKTFQTDAKVLFLNNSSSKEIVIHGHIFEEERTNKQWI